MLNPKQVKAAKSRRKAPLANSGGMPRASENTSPSGATWEPSA